MHIFDRYPVMDFVCQEANGSFSILCAVINCALLFNLLNNKTILLLKLAEFPLVLPNKAQRLVG